MVMYGATVIIYLLIVWTLSKWSDVSLYTYGVRTGTLYIECYCSNGNCSAFRDGDLVILVLDVVVVTYRENLRMCFLT